MRIAIRVDVSNEIGTGHFMRCLTLAEELKTHGSQIRFITQMLPKYMRDMLDAKGIECISLSADVPQELGDELAHAKWLVTSQAHDALASIQALADQLWDWVIVDHYALDMRWESLVREVCKKLMVIDDLADRQHDCDVLLYQNYFADMRNRYVSKVPAHCHLLLGPSYALLREDFRSFRKKVKVRTGNVKKVLVFFGGVDEENYTGLVIKALSELNISLQVDVVVGYQHPNREQLCEICINYGFRYHVQTTRMAELMAGADLAIGAGGSASWERCCLGLPGLIVAIAKNQVEIAKALDSIGACYFFGEKEVVSLASIKNSINELLVTSDQVRSISLQAFSLVDGLGIKRVSRTLGR